MLCNVLGSAIMVIQGNIRIGLGFHIYIYIFYGLVFIVLISNCLWESDTMNFPLPNSSEVLI